MTEFTPFASFAGGMLIGLSAVLLMLVLGRIAGMTGIVSGLLPPLTSDFAWKACFIAGAIGAPLVFTLLGGTTGFDVPVPVGALVIGGLITGIGVTFGSGCTSGHGVCGLARFSPRSAVAVVTFMGFAIITVFIIRHVLKLW